MTRTEQEKWEIFKHTVKLTAMLQGGDHTLTLETLQTMIDELDGVITQPDTEGERK